MVYLEAAIQGFPLKKVNLFYVFMCTWGGPVMGLISSKDKNSMSAVLVGVGSFVVVSQVFFLFYYLLCERLYWDGVGLTFLFLILNTLFILTYGRKVLWRALSALAF